MSEIHPPNWSLDASMRIWRKFGPHIVDSAKVVEMAWIITRVVLADPPAGDDAHAAARDRVMLDELQRRHRSAMLVGFVAMQLPQSAECDLRKLIQKALGAEDPQR